MIESFKVTFSQIIVLFAFIAIGYAMKKTGKVSADFSKGLSKLLVYIFLPFLTFENMATNFRFDVIAQKLELVLVSLCLLGAFFAIAFVFSRIFAKNKNTRDVYLYSFTIPNTGYMGNPLVLAIFGELMLFDYIIFCIPFTIFIYTFGVYILNPNRQFSVKGLVNPMMIALVLGMLAGALKVQFPAAVKTILDTGADCMAPAAMILTGIVFASNDMKSMVTNPKVYIACALKMIVIPVIAVFIIAAMNLPENIAVIVIIMMTLPCGLNSVVFPEAYGGDSKTGAQLCFVATLTCLIFMPLIFALYNMLRV